MKVICGEWLPTRKRTIITLFLQSTEQGNHRCSLAEAKNAMKRTLTK